MTEITPQMQETLYKLLKAVEFEYKCSKCGGPRHKDWPDCPLCGSKDYTDA